MALKVLLQELETGNTTYYTIFNQGTTEWEVGVGTVTDAAT